MSIKRNFAAIAIIFATGLTGCDLSGSRSVSPVEGAKRALEQPLFVDFVKHLPNWKVTLVEYKSKNEAVVYWKPAKARSDDPNVADQTIQSFSSESEAFRYFEENSEYLNTGEWSEPEWSKNLALKAKKYLLRCIDMPNTINGIQMVIECEYKLVSKNWVNTLYIYSSQKIPDEILSALAMEMDERLQQ